jgi:hypothetical protein
MSCDEEWPITLRHTPYCICLSVCPSALGPPLHVSAASVNIVSYNFQTFAVLFTPARQIPNTTAPQPHAVNIYKCSLCLNTVLIARNTTSVVAVCCLDTVWLSGRPMQFDFSLLCCSGGAFVPALSRLHCSCPHRQAWLVASICISVFDLWVRQFVCFAALICIVGDWCCRFIYSLVVTCMRMMVLLAQLETPLPLDRHLAGRCVSKLWVMHIIVRCLPYDFM